MLKFEVIDHWDVWGNKKDGYEVNDSSRLKEALSVKSLDDKDIIKALKDYGYFKKTLKMAHFDIQGDDTCIKIDRAKDGCPYCTLYLLRE
jgi:hypothetical protein